MRIFNLESEQWNPRALHEVFRFFAGAENLQQLTPPWIHFQIEFLFGGAH